MKINSTNVTIMVSDMDLAINFYTSLGFTVKQRWENNYAMIAAPDLVIGLHPTAEPIDPGNQISIGLMIDDIEAVKAFLTTNKIEYQYFEAEEGIYCNFKDPFGTSIYFTKPNWA